MEGGRRGRNEDFDGKLEKDNSENERWLLVVELSMAMGRARKGMKRKRHSTPEPGAAKGKEVSNR